MKLINDNCKTGSFSHDTSAKNRKDRLSKIEHVSEKEHELFESMLKRLKSSR